MAPNPPDDLRAVDFRYSQIEVNQVGSEGSQKLEALLAVLGNPGVESTGRVLGSVDLGDNLVVFDDEDSLHAGMFQRPVLLVLENVSGQIGANAPVLALRFEKRLLVR